MNVHTHMNVLQSVTELSYEYTQSSECANRGVTELSYEYTMYMNVLTEV